jgi:pilus assembly protein CpaC
MRISAAVLAALMLFGAAAETVAAQSVLRASRGLASNDVTVLTNRAVVVESTEAFVELSVAQPEIADVQPLSDRSIYILGKTRGSTTLTLLGEGGRLISNVTINVRPDLGELKQRLARLLPNDEIEVRSAAAGVVLSGVVSGAAKIDRAMLLARAYAGENVVNMMSVGGTQQVSLKVRIAEMSREAGKDLGISLGLASRNARAQPFAQTGNSITNNLGEGSFTGGGDAPQFSNVLSSFGVFGAIFSIANNYLLDVQIDALEERGFARLLAEPTLVALSGTEAEFLAGGEVPIPTVDDDGDVDVEFKPVGVNVVFQPTVLEDDLINLAVSAEVSSVDPALSTISNEVNITGFSVRRATTTIELRDGQSFAIAGLFQEDFQDTVSQVPWLGELPVLGTLFRSADFQRDQTELVIIVTVNLVIPVDDESQLAIPQDRVRIPNEAELFLMGETVGGESVFSATQGFDGTFGYVVE